MTDDELRYLRTKLKQGEYDGVDIMSAWIAIDELVVLRKTIVDAIAAERETVAAWIENLEGWQIDALDLPAEIRDGSHVTNKHVAIGRGE